MLLLRNGGFNVQDNLQNLANNFCKRFGLVEFKIPFTTAFSQADIVIYNHLFQPSSVESDVAKKYAIEHIRNFNRLMRYGTYEAAKGHLWEVANRTPAFTAEITRGSVVLLRAAIEIREHGRTTQKLKKEELEAANEVARRIKQFHKGAMQLFKDLLDLITKNAGKMPLIDDPRYTETYIHEFIHYILNHNNIVGSCRFNEGLCTYMHIRFRGNSAMASYRSFSANYLKWVPFFRAEIGRFSDGQIGNVLRSNVRKLSAQFGKGI